ncbi:hypothetical protein M0812_13163 [Anaeramoeba flamelloides]|uniref:GOST seven transmembrane domain-containing protein n=1 Tax=Anaeramoeba flamelloides TaxID=1746091 RepID=A0AAV7ZGL8_9EUKA|nr:hypothetical protein M0812_13163 [Anaeramoeba flamelloides]
MGFIILPIETIPTRYIEEDPISCSVINGFISENEYLIKKPKKKWIEGFTHETTIEKEGLYGVYFKTCETEPDTISYDLRLKLKNDDNYLSLEEEELPLVYLGFSLLYIFITVVWLSYLGMKRKNSKITKLHRLYTILLFAKMFAIISKSFGYYYLKKTGMHQGWNIPYYFFAVCKGILFIVVIVLLGTGYSSIKSSLNNREKKILMIVIPIQIITNIALIIVEETSPVNQSYFTWWDLLKFFDILCVCLILIPIFWSINHLKKVSTIDGKQFKNLEKITTFKQFYLITVCYIYFTRILIVFLSHSLSYKYHWISILAVELSTSLFLIFIGYKFRPYPENIIINIYGNGNGNDNDNDEELPIIHNDPLDTKSVIKRDIRDAQEIEDSENIYEN